MIFFAIGVAVVFSGLMGALWGLDPTIKWYADHDIVLLIARSTVAPVIAAWFVAELVNAVRPLRLFDRRIARAMPRLFAGLVAGVIGGAGASVLLAVAGGMAHDVVVLAGSSAAGTLLVLAPMRRVRRGLCIHCGYDIRSQPAPGSPGWGICPECGASVIPGREAPAAA